jgi:hypothetical protein
MTPADSSGVCLVSGLTKDKDKLNMVRILHTLK